MTRIWVPRCKIIEPKKEILLPMQMAGRFKLTKHGPDGRVRGETPWTDNLILDAGLDRAGSNVLLFGTVAVGTGNTAPTTSDTRLESLIASTTSNQSASQATDSNSPYSISKTVVYRFSTGTAAGNLAEVGIGWGASSLWSRALIVDEEGAPTTLTIQSDESLDVTYQLIGYPPLGDVEDTITITGSGDHDVVMRASGVGNSGNWTFDTTSGSRVFRGGGYSFNNYHRAYSGAIGAITGLPSGTSGDSSGVADATYTAGSFQRDYTVTWGLNNGNVGGIASVGTTAGALSGLGNARQLFQCSYDPVIAKDNTTVLALNFRFAWARAS